MRGYDPAADYLELTRGVFARRTSPLVPEASLIYQKALGRVPHEGGQRFGPDTVAARTVHAWLREGMPDDPPDLPALKTLEILPGPCVRTPPARWQQLAVLAHFSDGSVRDVTRLTVFSSSDPAVASVSSTGLVEFQQSGEVAILCRYLDVMHTVRLTFLEPKKGFQWVNVPENNYVDTFAGLQTVHCALEQRESVAEIRPECQERAHARRRAGGTHGSVPAPHCNSGNERGTNRVLRSQIRPGTSLTVLDLKRTAGMLRAGGVHALAGDVCHG